MAYALLRWIVLTVSVWVAAHLIPGISYDAWQSVVIAALVLGVLNAFVKPALSVLSLPLIILTMGLFVPVLNAALLALVAWIVPGFRVNGFWPAVGGSLVVSLVGFFIGLPGGRRRIVMARGEQAPRRGPPPGKGPIIDV